jgi:four helix bundle protein
MFDYERFEVYKKAKTFFAEISTFIENNKKLHNRIADQLYRAALSIPLNIAEGAGRYSKPDKRNFYTIARGSVFECTAIIDILHDNGLIDTQQKGHYYNDLEEVSKMLSGLINSLK